MPWMQRRRRPAVFLRFLSLLTLVAFAAVSFASSGSAQNSAKLDEIRERQTENTAEIETAERELLGIREQRQQLQVSLDQFTAALADANTRLAAAHAETDRLAVASVVLQIQVDATQQKLERARAAARRSAVQLYLRSDSSAMLDLIGSADGAGAVVEGRQYLKHVNGKRHASADRVAVLRSELADQSVQLAETRRAADAARDEAIAQQAQVATLQALQQQALDAAIATEMVYDAKHGDLVAQKSQLAAEFQAESDRIAAELAAAAAAERAAAEAAAAANARNSSNSGSNGGGSGSGSTAAAVDDGPTGNGTFIRPISGAGITSGFGYRTDPITGSSGLHSGIDFGAGCGTPIRAAGSGTVLSAGWNGGYGNATIINHGGGLATLYGHQSQIGVSGGQSVSQGEVIGYVGTTGRSTGCHLHFEVRVNGNPVNPLGYL
jgi:murein DD-endopeptidase MepM/ murein hydrolase activator NlpD